jgi:ribose transport system ATP-binding protein
MTALLSAKAITKRYGAVVALSDGGLELGHGEIHALLGANGCGKSTLCKIIAGTVAKDRGSLVLDGKPIEIGGPRDAEALGIALFYQELSLVPQLSVADNIFLGHERLGAGGFLDAKALRANAEALMARFASVAGDGFAPDATVSALSPDQRQIVEILKVLARKPRIIIFDEATAALDRTQVELFFAILRELKAEGMSSIFITHRMDEVFEITDAITVMRNGATVAHYATAETDRETVVHAMVGEVTALAERPARTAPIGDGSRLVLEGVRNARVHDVSLVVRPGEIVGLGGLQGQGQSGLLQGLFGSLPFTGGTVKLDGAAVRLGKPVHAIRRGLAYVSGDRGRDAAFHGRSIFENIAAASFAKERPAMVWPARLKQRFADAAAQLATKYSGLEAPIGSLSGGNQQKVFIARWLATSPSVLLLDDPTKGIDLGAKADFFALVRTLAAEGASILIYSSEDAELLSLCDRIVVFNSGTVAAELAGDELTAFNLANAAYGRAA